MTFPIVNDAAAHSRVHTRSTAPRKKKTEQSKFSKYGLFSDTWILIEELFSIGSLQYFKHTETSILFEMAMLNILLIKLEMEFLRKEEELVPTVVTDHGNRPLFNHSVTGAFFLPAVKFC